MPPASRMPVKTVEVLRAGWQHQRHGRTGAHAACGQAGGYGAGAPVQLRKADRRIFAVAAVQDDVGSVRVVVQVPAQHVRDRGGTVWRLRRGIRRCRAGQPRGRIFGAGRQVPGGEHGAQQCARGVGLGQYLLRQADAETLLDAGQQFGARQAVEAQFGLERAVHRGCGRRAGFRLRPHGGRHLPHDAEQGIFVVLPRG